MLRRILAALLVMAISAAPAVGLVLNSQTLTSEKLCCDEMANSCSVSADPHQCCDKPLVAVESALQLSKIVFIPPLLAFESAPPLQGMPFAADFAMRAVVAESPPLAPSPPLVLRI